MKAEGYPAYVTSAGWLGYSDEQIEALCRQELQRGFTRFKAKVGVSVEDDRRRLRLIRNTIGNDCLLMVTFTHLNNCVQKPKAKLGFGQFHSDSDFHRNTQFGACFPETCSDLTFKLAPWNFR